MDMATYNDQLRSIADLRDKIENLDAALSAELERTLQAAAERDQHMKRADTLTQQCRGLDEQVLFLQEQSATLEDQLFSAREQVEALVKAVARGEAEIQSLRYQLRKSEAKRKTGK